MKKLYTRVNGEKGQILEKAKVFKFGRMALFMKAGGSTTRQMEEDD